MSLKSSKEVEANVYELEIEISAEDFMAANKRAYNKNKKRINIPGFRKGKAPLSIIERMYGEDFFYEDAMEELFPSLIAQAYEETKIDAVANPYDYTVKEMGKDGVLFTVKVAVKPEVEMGDYKGIKAPKAKATVSKKEVDEEIERLRERNSRTITVEGRPAQDGDTAVIDFEGFIDDVAFEGGKGENHNLILGSGSFIPGFEEQIIGKNTGDEFDVNVSFPEEYTPELAGKAAVFKVKLHEIKEKELPELDDEFVKDVSEYDTLAELKKSIKEDLSEGKAESVEKEFEQAVIEKLIDLTKVEIPHVMIEKRAQENIADYEKQLKSSGFELDMYLQMTGMDRPAFEARMYEDAHKQVKMTLALEKIAELEDIQVSEEDLEAEYKKIAEAYSMEAEAVKPLIPVDALKEDILNQKALQLVLDQALVEETQKAKPKAEKAKKEDKKEGKAAEKKESKPKAKPKAKAKPAADKAKKEDKKD
ncbi:MAG: trigger factor [Clostridiales bacterium]|nr:trigger factor [Clostridiales bacterium]